MEIGGVVLSQSLSGWDGVFHQSIRAEKLTFRMSQSLSGWDGVFHETDAVLHPSEW